MPAEAKTLAPSVALSPHRGHVRDDITHGCGGDDPRDHSVASSTAAGRAPSPGRGAGRDDIPHGCRCGLMHGGRRPPRLARHRPQLRPQLPLSLTASSSGKPRPTAVRADSPAEAKTPASVPWPPPRRRPRPPPRPRPRRHPTRPSARPCPRRRHSLAAVSCTCLRRRPPAHPPLPAASSWRARTPQASSTAHPARLSPARGSEVRRQCPQTHEKATTKKNRQLHLKG